MPETRFLNVGDEVPDVRLPGLDGSQHGLSDFAGRRLIVFMWASW